MNITGQIAKLFRDAYFGGNWTAVNLKDTLADVTWEQAATKVYSFNTIAVLVYHINYYVRVVSKVLMGEELNASDEFSFDAPPVRSHEDWVNLLEKTWSEADTFAGLIEKFPEDMLGEIFFNNKYGSFYRNLHGVIEHAHYHLGQIVLIKKIIANADATAK